MKRWAARVCVCAVCMCMYVYVCVCVSVCMYHVTIWWIVLLRLVRSTELSYSLQPAQCHTILLRHNCFKNTLASSHECASLSLSLLLLSIPWLPMSPLLSSALPALQILGSSWRSIARGLDGDAKSVLCCPQNALWNETMTIVRYFFLCFLLMLHHSSIISCLSCSAFIHPWWSVIFLSHSHSHSHTRRVATLLTRHTQWTVCGHVLGPRTHRTQLLVLNRIAKESWLRWFSSPLSSLHSKTSPTHILSCDPILMRLIVFFPLTSSLSMISSQSHWP